MKKDTIIFDLDGTLLNSLGDLHACFNAAISNYGYPTRTEEEIKSFVGNGIKRAIEQALPYKIENSELEEIVNYFRNYYRENMYKLTKPYDGIIELLEILKQRNYKLAVVSNKYDLAVKSLCKQYFGNYINVAIGESENIRRKPAPDGILLAIKYLNSTIEKSIFIGDSEVDIKTAENIKIPCISVLWGYRNKELLTNAGGNIFANTPEDIIKIIEKKLFLG